jgi:23S rRNA (adenine2503-C2)-methyltransferase
MKILKQIGKDDIATVFIADFGNGKLSEFVESVHPPRAKSIKKLVYILSTLYGCPVQCKFCDAGGFYSGKQSAEDIFSQIDYMVKKRFASNKIDVERFKVQFSRMGEPSMNPSVLDVLREFPKRYETPCFIPSLSTIAPNGTEDFFDRLLEIKKEFYDDSFQLQFSIHSTDEKYRNWLMPVNKWSFKAIAEYSKRFYSKGGKKITLNFALDSKTPVNPGDLLKCFDPETFLIKITPINPTHKAYSNKFDSYVNDGNGEYSVLKEFESSGYEVILSVGELEENDIGSNCGQHIVNLLKQNVSDKEYPLLGRVALDVK